MAALLMVSYDDGLSKNRKSFENIIKGIFSSYGDEGK